MIDVRGRVAMVSGASRGIGRAIMERLLADGWNVSAGVRNVAAMPSHPNLLVTPYHATEVDDPVRWTEATVRRFGAVHAVVNVAGILRDYRLEDTGEAALDETWLVNVKAPLRLIRAAMPHLRTCGEGRVINVSSLSGKRVANTNVAYSMSKFAMTALTHTVRREGWDDGVRATVICPGFVNTDMVASVDTISQDQMTQPEDLAVLVGTVLRMPNTAVVAELLVNCRLEAMY